MGRSEMETCPRGRSKSPCPQLEESQHTSVSVLCRQLPGNPGNQLYTPDSGQGGGEAVVGMSFRNDPAPRENPTQLKLNPDKPTF